MKKRLLFGFVLTSTVLISGCIEENKKLQEISIGGHLTFELNKNEIECYKLGFVNIDLRLNLSNDLWNKNLLLSKVKCQDYNSIEDYPYQIEAIGTISNETPNYASSLYVEPNLKEVYFYGLYSREYSEECLIVGNKIIFSQIWQGGEREPLVTEGNSRCRWLSDEEVEETGY